MNNAQLKAMLASYGRSVLSAATALYLAGVTNPADLLWSLAAAILPVVLRAVNPKDKAFGRVPTVEEVTVAVSTANVTDGKKLAAKVTKPAATKKPAPKTKK